MCGIAGYKIDRPIAPQVLSRMVEGLKHRGPDSDGYHRDRAFAAGMRRLAINDVAGGGQPLFGEAGHSVLFYNGEIYNYRELRRKLEVEGHVFRTNSDGEVICHLYRHYGDELFEHLDGMFAAALWIPSESKLILARDLAGEKPLYYSELCTGQIVFASEISALKTFPGLGLTLDRQAIWDFPTFLWIPEPATIFTSISALPPGHTLTVQDNVVRVRPYRNRFNRDAIDLSSYDAVVHETRRVVEGVIKSQLLSDVPIGSFLSGGLDSSIVATIAARDLNSLETFSVGFEDVHDPYHGHADESAAAAATAKAIGSRHTSIAVTGKTFRDKLERFCRHGDQPFAISSGLGIMAVAEAARERGIKVLLSGDGADEAFGGYSWYAHLAQSADNSATICNGIISYQNFGLPLETRLACIRKLDPASQAWAWHYYAHEREKAALFGEEFSEGLQSSLRHFAPAQNNGFERPLDFISHDRRFYFPNEMLRKLDRMTMSYSVEGRAPFAAAPIASHAEKLRFCHLIGENGNLKRALRDAFSDILLEDVVRRPKHGFNVPIDHWLKNDWSDLVDTTFASNSALTRNNMLGPNARLIAQKILHDPVRLSGHSIFCMVMLNMWLEQNEHANNR